MSKIHEHYIVERVGVAVDREGTVMLQLFSEDQPRGKRVFLTPAAASVMLFKMIVVGIRHPWVRLLDSRREMVENAKEDSD